MMRTIYLAGKITGDPGYKEKFGEAAFELERRGWVVLNPAVLPPAGFSYDAYMRMSTAMLRECDCVCFLSDWTASAGAKQEMICAIHEGKVVVFYDQFKTVASPHKTSVSGSF
ncbi:MAG: DUF4406 domain-containing protein [Clostridia bacterium]|nr:DUF4406 domain-containing protein [Clostridia bacterium]